MKLIIKNIKDSFKLILNDEKSTKSLIKAQNWIRPLAIILILSFLSSLLGGFISALIIVVVTTIASFTSVAWLHGFMKVFGGKGTYKQTLTMAFNIQLIPSIVFTILTFLLIISLKVSMELYALLGFIMILATFFYLPWFIIIFTQTLALTHKLSMGKTYIAEMLSFVTFILLITLIFSILIGILAPGLIETLSYYN